MGYKYIAEFDIGEKVILDEGTKLLGTVKSVTFGSNRKPAYFVEFEHPKQDDPGVLIYQTSTIPEGKMRRPTIFGSGVDEVDEKLQANPPLASTKASTSFLAALDEVSGPIEIKP